MKTSESLLAFGPAYAKAKKAMAPVLKQSNNPAFRSKYADLGNVIEAIEDALLANDIIFIQGSETVVEEGGTHAASVPTMLLHTKSGEYIQTDTVIRPTKQDPQGIGGAYTYGRRYALLALAGVAPEDDDGNTASKREPYQAPARASAPNVVPIEKAAEHGSAAEIIKARAAINRLCDDITLTPWEQQETVQGVIGEGTDLASVSDLGTLRAVYAALKAKSQAAKTEVPY